MVRKHWRDQAACHGLPMEWFFPEKPNGDTSYDQGKRVCATCPVTEQCLAHALKTGEAHGIWGGLNEVERRALRAQP